jgi:hypothetical protein
MLERTCSLPNLREKEGGKEGRREEVQNTPHIGRNIFGSLGNKRPMP